jgi:gas vesicle protein GvpA/GvpJ/GvpM family
MLDVLDRVLDKGIVIAFDVDVSVAGLTAVRVTGHVIVASIERYQGYAAQQSVHDVGGDVDVYLGRVRGARVGRPAES